MSAAVLGAAVLGTSGMDAAEVGAVVTPTENPSATGREAAMGGRDEIGDGEATGDGGGALRYRSSTDAGRAKTASRITSSEEEGELAEGRLARRAHSR